MIEGHRWRFQQDNAALYAAQRLQSFADNKIDVLDWPTFARHLFKDGSEEKPTQRDSSTEELNIAAIENSFEKIKLNYSKTLNIFSEIYFLELYLKNGYSTL